MRILLILVTLFGALTGASAYADDGSHASNITDALLHLNLLNVALWSLVLLAIVIVAAIVVNPVSQLAKHVFFWTIAALSLSVTALFILQTTVKNIASETKGPVHWHADFRIFECGEELDLLDPSGLLNRIGTPTLHEHNDKRIHVEGTMLSKSDAALGKFFGVIGGSLTETSMVVPTNYGMVEATNGDSCKDEDGPGEVQVFLWSITDNHATQRKLENFTDYVMSAHSPVPPGDCIIVEFGTPKPATEHVCEQYKVAKKNGKILLDDSPIKP